MTESATNTFATSAEQTQSMSLAALLRARASDPALFARYGAIGADDEESVAASDAELHSHMPPIASFSSAANSCASHAAPQLSSAHSSGKGGSGGGSAGRQRRTQGFDYAGDDVAALGAGSVTPQSRPSLLRELAERPALPTNPLRQSAELRAVARECEIIIFDGGRLREPTNVRDMRRLLRHYDDFALRHRPEVAGVAQDSDAVDVCIDRAHQMALFVARVKLLHALQCALPREHNATALALCHKSEPRADHYWARAATAVGERELYVWLAESGASHPSMLDERNRRVLVRHCSIETLWKSLLQLMRIWPRLPMSAELVRYFDELRARVAFFCSYRERAPDVYDPAALGDDDSFFSDSDDDGPAAERTLTIEQRMERANDKLMGLNLGLFGLLDLNAEVLGEPIGAAGKSQSRAQAADANADEPLIDNYEFMRVTRNDETGDAFVHVNMDFVDECERVLHALQRQLRTAAGFVHADSPSLTVQGPEACLACDERSRIIAPQVDRLYALIRKQLFGSFRSFIEEQFREQLFSYYIEPSEMEQFTEYHPQEVHNPLNCVSRKRNTDFKVMSARYIEKSAANAWADYLEAAPQEPAHALLAALTLNFTMRQDANGAQFEPYYVRGELLEPHPYTPARHRDAGRATRYTRVLADQLYEPLRTTGTLRYRYQLAQREGGEAPRAHTHYEHPLVVRQLNSHALLYRGHLHPCESFAHAYLRWLLVICADRHIAGYLHNGAALHQFASALMPEQNDALLESQRSAEARIQRWNPMARIVDEDEVAAPPPANGADEQAAVAAAASATATQLPMHAHMTQF